MNDDDNSKITKKSKKLQVRAFHCLIRCGGTNPYYQPVLNKVSLYEKRDKNLIFFTEADENVSLFII